MKLVILIFNACVSYDRIASKHCDDMITLERYNEFCLFWGCEELSHKNNWFETFILTEDIETNLRETYMFCVVNCKENDYVANYKKMENQWNIKGILMKGKKIPIPSYCFLR